LEKHRGARVGREGSFEARSNDLKTDLDAIENPERDEESAGSQARTADENKLEESSSASWPEADDNHVINGSIDCTWVWALDLAGRFCSILLHSYFAER
jgi:hypothetical protein